MGVGPEGDLSGPVSCYFCERGMAARQGDCLFFLGFLSFVARLMRAFLGPYFA